MQSVQLLTTTSRHLSVRGTGLATVAKGAWPKWPLSTSCQDKIWCVSIQPIRYLSGVCGQAVTWHAGEGAQVPCRARGNVRHLLARPHTGHPNARIALAFLTAHSQTTIA